MTSFEDAARRMLGAPPEATISSEWYDGGNDGCDTCGHGSTSGVIEVRAYLWTSGKEYKSWGREFTDLPSLWEALFTEEDS